MVSGFCTPSYTRILSGVKQRGGSSSSSGAAEAEDALEELSLPMRTYQRIRAETMPRMSGMSCEKVASSVVDDVVSMQRDGLQPKKTTNF